MIPTRYIKELQHIEDRVNYYARDVYNRVLPEMRFFVLDAQEFISLLEKRVFPTSPVNVWEGKNVTKRKFQVETGQESGIYYEVVQTGSPSYAYLNENNSLTTQASVMAHVVGHCEFSELNVMGDSDDDRTEYIMYLTKMVDTARRNMGFNSYIHYWNACESVTNFIAPNSQYNLLNSIDTDEPIAYIEPDDLEKQPEKKKFFSPYSGTLDSILNPINQSDIISKDKELKSRNETVSRKGYKLKAPCQDILGFLRNYAPTSAGERAILDYLYAVNRHSDFVIRTQIMNEGWAMTWEKKIMMDLFREKTVNEVIDYCKVFSGVCYPRPYFQRNPYHLGFNMWKKVEDMYKKGKVCLEYAEEISVKAKEEWNKPTGTDPMKNMEHIVKTCTDFEFLRRYLDHQDIEDFHLNKMPIQYLQYFDDEAVYKNDGRHIWIDQAFVKEEMLKFFTDYGRPRVYVIDDEYVNGGLLLYHRHTDRALRSDWIPQTLKNINHIWKAPVYLITGEDIYVCTDLKIKRSKMEKISFDRIREKMSNGEKPVSTSVASK
jgi:stage V sporulation protein R